MRSHTAQLVKLFATATVASLLSLSPSAEAQSYKFEVLHAFHGKDGAGPVGVLRDASGNLYGTAATGGTGSCRNSTCGVAFKLNQSGKPIWVHSFNGGNGLDPQAGLLRDGAGNLYGTTYYGGELNQCSDFGCGTVFKLNPEGREAVLHIFTGSPDGQLPAAPLAEDSPGNLYGTTLEGGKVGSGTVFRIDKNGHETVLYDFCTKTNCSDGASPVGGVILDAAGNLYGTAASGGSFSNGVVFKIDRKSSIETVLHSFTEGDGALPRSTLIQDEAGNLYGTTQRGGHGGGTGGVVFELSPQSGGKWKETTLYKFCAQRHCPDGNMPTGQLVRDSAGNLYGTTLLGGAGFGVVFELAPNGKETLLYSFAGLRDGGEPVSLIQDNVGNLYGTAVEGGDLSCAEGGGGCGVVFRLTPQ